MDSGDQVWILENGNVPFVLRPTGKRGETFILVGECYLHGVMDGQLFEAGEPDWTELAIV